MKDEKMISHISRYVQEAKKAVAGLNEDQVKDIAMFFAHQFIEEIKQGLEGAIDYENAPFFEKVDHMYEEAAAPPSGCYFCDRSIDGNSEPFDYPQTTKLCLTCMLKVANLLKAFGIDHRSLFPWIKASKIQQVMYEAAPTVVRGKKDVLH